MLWLTEGTGTCNSATVTLKHVFIANRTRRIRSAETVWPSPGSDLKCAATVSDGRIQSAGTPGLRRRHHRRAAARLIRAGGRAPVGATARPAILPDRLPAAPSVRIKLPSARGSPCLLKTTVAPGGPTFRNSLKLPEGGTSKSSNGLGAVPSE